MVPGTTTELVPVFTVPVQRISLAERLLLAARERAALIADGQRRHRTFWFELWVAVWKTPPETLEAHRAHLKSRAWLQDYMTGHIRWLIEYENIAYGILIARPAKSLFQTLDKIFERQSRLGILIGVIIVGYLIHLVSHL